MDVPVPSKITVVLAIGIFQYWFSFFASVRYKTRPSFALLDNVQGSTD